MEQLIQVISDKYVITAIVVIASIWVYDLFGGNRVIKKTKAEIERVENEMIKRIYSQKDYNSIPFTEVVDCEICGCMLFKFNAVKGESTIEKVPLPGNPNMLQQTKEVIKEHYFCKAHAPKGVKK